VLGVVEEGHGIVVAAEQEDLAVELQEPLEGRPTAERVVPRLPGNEVDGLSAPHDEACDVRMDHGAGIRAQELDQRSVVARGSCREGIEGGKLFEQLAFLVRAEVAAPGFVVVGGTAGVHHQRPVGGNGVLECEMDLVGPASDLPDRANGGMHHERVARSDAQFAKSAGERLSGMHR